MDLGPVQLLVIGFDHPEFRGEIAAELARLSDAGLVRVIDALIVSKDDEGEVTALEASELSVAEIQELGATIGALIGLGAGGVEGAELGAALGAEAGADGSLLDDLDLVHIEDEIPPGSTAAILLIDHQWARPLREAIGRANGTALIDMWVHPLDLVSIGLAGAADIEGAS
jgi:uncharacterized membrane protein